MRAERDLTSTGGGGGAALGPLLRKAGYTVVFRSGAWVECLVHREAERWLGRGASEADALVDAVRGMLRSHLSRTLLGRLVVAVPVRAAASAPPEPVAAVAPAPEPVAAVVAPPEPEPVAAVAPAPEPVAAVAPAPEPEPVAPAPEPEPVAPPPEPVFATPEQRACYDLDLILSVIESELASFARLSPDRQRLRMLIWVTRARRIEEAYPGDSEVERHTSAVVRRLSDLGKKFWPGMVRALQLNARPANVPELRVRWAPVPGTWAEAAEMLDRLMAEHLEECVAAGLDAEGWASEPREAALDGDAEKVFKEAVLALDSTLLAVLGSGKSAALNQVQLERLLSAAKKLRWARSRVRDSVAWGAAMGSLRKLLPTIKMRGKRVEHAIDPHARPDPPW